MKKIFTLIAVALTALSVNAQTKLSVASGWETTIEDVVLTGDVVFNYKNSYATVYMDITEVDLSQYPSYEIVVSNDTPVDKLQLYVKSNNTDGENWSGTFTAGTTTLTFVPEGAGKITSIGLQAANVADLGKVEIISASLIDTNNNKTPLNYIMPASWSADVTSPFADVTVSFTTGNQWTAASVKGAEGLALPQTITMTAESFPSSVQLKIVDSNKNEYYKELPEGESTFTTDVMPASEGATIASIDIQNTVGRDPFKIKKVNVEIKPYEEPNVLNVMSSLGTSGWNSELNGKTITITSEDVVGGKGWWVKPADYSHYDNFVVEFESTPNGGNVVVQYVADGAESSSVEFYPGATCVVVPLDAANKSAVQQMWVQGATGATFTLKDAYLAVASVTPEAQLGEPTAISTVKAATQQDGAIYNLAGQRVDKAYKGIVIMNGKKVVKK